MYRGFKRYIALPSSQEVKGLFKYFFFLGTTQRVQTKNMDGLIKAIQQKSRVNPLITVSNHASCLDDPTIWGNNK